MSDDMIARARRIVDDKRNQTHLRPWAEALLAEREAREQAEARVAELEATLLAVVDALYDEVNRLRAALRDLADDVITRADARAALAGTFSQRESTEPSNFTESGKVPQPPASTIPDTTGLRDKDSSERCPTCGSADPELRVATCAVGMYGDDATVFRADPWHDVP